LATTFQKGFERWLPCHPRDRPRCGSGSIINAFHNRVAEPRRHRQRGSSRDPRLRRWRPMVLRQDQAGAGRDFIREVKMGKGLGIVHRRIRLTPGSQPRGNEHPRRSRASRSRGTLQTMAQVEAIRRHGLRQKRWALRAGGCSSAGLNSVRFASLREAGPPHMTVRGSLAAICATARPTSSVFRRPQEPPTLRCRRHRRT
jgi:hypothetical protein